MIVCQNDDNQYQFTVMLEDDEIMLFDEIRTEDFEHTLYNAIMVGMVNHEDNETQ